MKILVGRGVIDPAACKWSDGWVGFGSNCLGKGLGGGAEAEWYFTLLWFKGITIYDLEFSVQ